MKSNKEIMLENDELSLKKIVLQVKNSTTFIVTKWKFILLISFISSFFGFYYAYSTKTKYSAVLTFALEEDKGGGFSSGLGGAIGLASQFGIDLGTSGGGGAFAGSNLVELMKSRKMVEKTLLSPIDYNGKKISLADYYINFTKMYIKLKKDSDLNNLTYKIGENSINFNRKKDSVLLSIYNSIKENILFIDQKDKKSSLINIKVISVDENFSKIFCETIANETSRYYAEIKSKKAQINVNVLQKQADSIRSELNNAINGVASASDNVYNLNPALNIKSTPAKKRQIDVQANTAILSQLVANLELAKVALRKETPLIQVIDNPIFPLEKIRISKIKSIILGGIFGCFISILYFFSIEYYKKIMLD